MVKKPKGSESRKKSRPAAPTARKKAAGGRGGKHKMAQKGRHDERNKPPLEERVELEPLNIERSEEEPERAIERPRGQSQKDRNEDIESIHGAEPRSRGARRRESVESITDRHSEEMERPRGKDI